MSQYHWDKLARALLPRHARPIAKTIFTGQAKPNGVSFFLEHSEAASTLDACIEADAQGVWEELAPHLTEDHSAALFSIGLPHHIMGALPRHAILDWIAVDPEQRARRIANITAKNFADTSLAAAILDRWGTLEHVKEQCFSAFVSGGWSGDASAHWEQLATDVDGIAKQTKLIGVRRWALASARELRRMAERDRKREAEERIRGYG